MMSVAELKEKTENLLHENPELYEAFYGCREGEETSMAYFFEAILEKYRPGKRVLDAGCGLGREADYLRRAGYRVEGLDNSKEMLEWAKIHYPDVKFIEGDLKVYRSGEVYDAICCAGSSFMYNFTNESALGCLKCFRANLRTGGILYMDMRNGAAFLTEKGQERLKQEAMEEAIYQGVPVSMRVRLSIDPVSQILNRDYFWTVPGRQPVRERLLHRLFFPQEMALMLSVSNFRLIRIFDKPDAHNGYYKKGDPLDFTDEMTGSRMQVLAEAV